MAQRLPIPGSDDNAWGDILNGFLGVSLNSDGSIKAGATPGATTSVAGAVQLTGDLGGTAASPTTPTAVHLAGAETITGAKTFSVSPTVPTPASTDSSTAVATTAFVKGAAPLKFAVPQNYSGSVTWLRLATVTAVASVGSDLSFTIGGMNNWTGGRSVATVSFGCYGTSSSASYGVLRATYQNGSDGQSSFYTRQASSMVYEIWMLMPTYQTATTLTVIGGFNYVINIDSSSTTAPSSPSPVAATQTTDVASLAPLASPAFTGAPTVPNEPDGARDSTIANTTYVRRALDLYGIGTAAYDLSNTDANNIGGTGFYKGYGMSNVPSTGWWFIEHIRHDDSWATQRAMGFTDYAGRSFTRIKYNGGWGGWSEDHKSLGDFDSSYDWNGFTRPGTYRGNNATGGSNGPGGYGWGYLHVKAAGIGWGIVQEWIPDDGPSQIMIRVNYSGSGWSGWRRVYLNDAGNDGYSGITLMNNASDAQSGNNYVIKTNRLVYANFSIYCGSAFGSTVGTIAQLPSGWQPTRGNAEIILRTSGGYTVWASVGTDGYVNWRAGGTAASGICPAGQSMYGGCSFIS